MRLIQSDLFRAVCMIAIGALVVRYRQQTLTGITVVIGVLFFVSGLLSCVSYCYRRHKLHSSMVEANPAEMKIGTSMPSMIVGVGSMLFGLVLALMPTTFLSFIEQILALLLILGAIGQMANLVAINRQAHVHWAYWIMPILILIVGIIVLAKPLELLSAPLFVTGWCMMLYGVVELLYALKIYLLRKQMEKAKESESIDFEEITDDTPQEQL